MENMSDEKRRELERRRVSLTIRFNGRQRMALHKIYFGNQNPHSSLSQIVREAVSEHLKNKYGVNIDPNLDFVDE